MRILVTIPHFFSAGGRRASDGHAHGSVGRRAEPRVQALTECVNAIRQLFGSRQVMMEPSRRVARPANQSLRHNIDVVICTTGESHLLGKLRLPANSFEHRATECAPILLGYECQAVLRDRIGAYDYYCYLEDDLVLHDAWFFAKLAWFRASVGDASVLQPNRYEVGSNPYADKVYLDGDLPRAVTRKYQDVREAGRVEAMYLGARIAFQRALNPHAGCYFLSAVQMEHWAKQPQFLDRSTEWVGPLESAATLGVMRSFRVYKPAAANAAFLELQHYGSGFLDQVRHAAAAAR